MGGLFQSFYINWDIAYLSYINRNIDLHLADLHSTSKEFSDFQNLFQSFLRIEAEKNCGEVVSSALDQWRFLVN